MKTEQEEQKSLKALLYDKFEDNATNYFQDEPSTRAGMQLQIDAWNDAIDQVKSFINSHNIVQVETLEILKYKR